VLDRWKKWEPAEQHDLEAVTGITPDRVTTDGHDSYGRAIRTALGKGVQRKSASGPKVHN
jgi:hypothetical protein